MYGLVAKKGDQDCLRYAEGVRRYKFADVQQKAVRSHMPRV